MRADVASQLQSIPVGHVDIKNDDIGSQGIEQTQALATIACLCHDIEALAGFQQRTQSTPEQRVVINQNSAVHSSLAPGPLTLHAYTIASCCQHLTACQHDIGQDTSQ